MTFKYGHTHMHREQEGEASHGQPADRPGPLLAEYDRGERDLHQIQQGERISRPPVSESRAVRQSVSRVSRMPSACRSLKAPVKRLSSGLLMAATASGRASHGIGSSTPKI